MTFQKVLILFLIFLIISCTGNNRKDRNTKTHSLHTDLQNRDTIRAADTTIRSTEKLKRLFIKYKNRIDGYQVKIEWTPSESYEDCSKGLATIYFENPNGYRFSIIDSAFVSSALINTDIKREIAFFKKDTVIYLNYPVKSKREIIRRDVPFSFADVDFDDKKELVMTVFGEGQRHTDIYRVFRLDSVGNIVEKSKQVTYLKPFIDFDGFTKFDQKNKIVTNTFDGGAENSSYETFVYGSGKAKINMFRLKHIVAYVDGVKKIYYTKDKLTKSIDYLKMDFENSKR